MLLFTETIMESMVATIGVQFPQHVIGEPFFANNSTVDYSTEIFNVDTV
jgi:hypothetical protein